jgi:outer membrane protein with beta-barrel domain
MFLAGASNPAHGDTPRPRVLAEVEGCGEARGDEIKRILGIELRAELLGAKPGQSSDTTVVHIVCSDSVIELRVEDPITGKSLARTIDLGASAPRGSARLVALAASELVSASWTEIEANPRPTVPPAGTPPPAAAVEAAREVVVERTPALATRSLRIMGVLGTQFALAGGGVGLGGGVRVGLGDAAHPLGFEVDLRAQHSSDATPPLGSVAIDSLSSAATLLYYLGLTRAASLYGGAGLRVGAARLTGDPGDPATVQAGTSEAPWLGPEVRLGLGLALTKHLRADVEVELGDVLLDATGKVLESNVGVRGSWLGLELGVGVVP